MKPKEYLVSIGALKEIGRGRLSLAHIEMCKKAAAEGVRIDGYSVSQGDTSTAPVVTKEKISTEKVIADLPPQRFPEDEFRLYELADGKKVPRGLRDVCKNSGVSVIYCPCDSHRIVARDGSGDVNVYVERK